MESNGIDLVMPLFLAKIYNTQRIHDNWQVEDSALKWKLIKLVSVVQLFIQKANDEYRIITQTDTPNFFSESLMRYIE